MEVNRLFREKDPNEMLRRQGRIDAMKTIVELPTKLLEHGDS